MCLVEKNRFKNTYKIYFNKNYCCGNLLQQKVCCNMFHRYFTYLRFVATSFQRYFIATCSNLLKKKKNFVAINYSNNIFCCNKVFLIIIKIFYCNKLIATKCYYNEIFVAIVYCHKVYCSGQ